MARSRRSSFPVGRAGVPGAGTIADNGTVLFAAVGGGLGTGLGHTMKGGHMAQNTARGSRTNGNSAVVGGPDHHDDLARHLSVVALTLHQQASTQDTLDEIVRAAVGTVPGARHAGLMMVLAKHEVQTVSVTDELPRDVDQVQYETGQGPCLDALYADKVVGMPDLAREERWPAFTEGAGLLKVSSMLSFQLFVHDDDLGALNLYSPEVEAFGDESEHVGSLFAGHAAMALAASQEREHLTEAIRTRDLIGQAKGILMERHKLTGDQAFTVLVRASQRANVKLHDLAEKLVQTGELTPPPGKTL